MLADYMQVRRVFWEGLSTSTIDAVFHVRRRLTSMYGELDTGLYPRFNAEGSLVLPQWMTFMPRLMGRPWLVVQ
jgi:hypothetical protein